MNARSGHQSCCVSAVVTLLMCFPVLGGAAESMSWSDLRGCSQSHNMLSRNQITFYTDLRAWLHWCSGTKQSLSFFPVNFNGAQKRSCCRWQWHTCDCLIIKLFCCVRAAKTLSANMSMDWIYKYAFMQRLNVTPLNVGQVIFMLHWFLDIWCWWDVAVQELRQVLSLETEKQQYIKKKVPQS